MSAHYSDLINRTDSETVPFPSELSAARGQNAYTSFFKPLFLVETFKKKSSLIAKHIGFNNQHIGNGCLGNFLLGVLFKMPLLM